MRGIDQGQQQGNEHPQAEPHHTATGILPTAHEGNRGQDQGKGLIGKQREEHPPGGNLRRMNPAAQIFWKGGQPGTQAIGR